MSDLLTFLTTHEDQFRRNRLAALYSDFRHLRTVNPDGYAANIEAWRKGLTDAAKGGHISSRGSPPDTLVLQLNDELLRALEHPEWGRPMALGTVVRDAMAKKEMMPLVEYQAAQNSIYQSSWVISPLRILTWGLRQLGLGEGQHGEDKLPVGKLVILANVEEMAEAITRRAERYTAGADRIFSNIMFAKEFADVLGSKVVLSQTDMSVLLKYMSREKDSIAYDGQTVKFRRSTEPPTSTITIEDTTIASLKTLMADLEAQISVLNARVDAMAITAKSAVLRKNRVVALAALRSKKLAERRSSKQTAVLGQLEDVYSKIVQASDQVELVRIMEGSTGVLKALNAEIGGVDRVDDVVDQLKEQMTQVDEIGSIMAEPGQTTVVDESEVDAELEEMEREDGDREETIRMKLAVAKEAKEVEETSRRLKELGTVEAKETGRREQETQKAFETSKPLGTALEEDNLRSSRMSLDESRTAEPVT